MPFTTPFTSRSLISPRGASNRRLKIFPAPHGIPIDEQWREVESFLEQYLR
jgi:hypothetical protein